MDKIRECMPGAEGHTAALDANLMLTINASEVNGLRAITLKFLSKEERNSTLDKLR